MVFEREGVLEILEQLVLAGNKLALVDSVFDPPVLRSGATQDEIAAVETYLGRALPPQLKLLLSTTNGAANLLIFGDLFSTREMLPGSEPHDRLVELQVTFVGEGVNFDMEYERLVPLGVLGLSDFRDQQPNCTYIEPSVTSADGEWSVVEHDHSSGNTRHSDLSAYLRSVLDKMKLFIAQAEAPSVTEPVRTGKANDRPMLLDVYGRPIKSKG